MCLGDRARRGSGAGVLEKERGQILRFWDFPEDLDFGVLYLKISPPFLTRRRVPVGLQDNVDLVSEWEPKGSGEMDNVSE